MVSEERITNGIFNTSPVNASQLAPLSWTCGHNASYGSYAYSTNFITYSAGTCLIVRTTHNSTDWASAEQSVNFTGVTNITFWYYCDNTAVPPLSIIIDSTIVYTMTSYTKDAWTQVTVPISGFSGLHTLKIYLSPSATGVHIRIDNISALATVLSDFVVSNFTPTVNLDIVTFTSTSQGASSYLWDFGDGTTSTLQNPTHVYTSDGAKTVTLKINGGNTGDYLKTATVTVQDPRALIRSGFEWL